MGISVRRAGGAGLAALLLAAGAVSCGKGEDEPKMSPAAAAVAKAASHAEDITSAHYRMTGQVPQQGRFTAEAAMRIKPSIAMSMKMTGTGQGAQQSAEVRLVDKVMYINGGAEAAKELNGKHWVKFDLSGTQAGEQLDQLSSASAQAQQNPAADTSMLTGAKDTKEVGTETVDGVKTTHYQGTATLDELRTAMEEQDKDKDATLREQHQQSLKQFEDLGVEKITMDLWVDGEDRAKQFRMRGDADGGPFDMTFTFLDYNKPVDVAAPAASDTAKLEELLMGSAEGAEGSGLQ
ncbi:MULTISPECIES: LppX_LprAFG lipoprotein [Streptomyces]|uniref:LppX_LprAFG lipoprotein n=1 Tax=Streptomyces TaxID=1883 RepID=UPI00203F3A79|nr:LppX_LprAFG lipoprotein [Streptomyces thermoviolaceus]MCM3263619.1 DUF1396 domain-containing protein [Streptomyces thermoviolaceus]